MATIGTEQNLGRRFGRWTAGRIGASAATICMLSLGLRAGAQQTSLASDPKRGLSAESSSSNVAASVLGGVVLDANGAMVMGARVRLDNGHSDLSRTVDTDAEGRFRFSEVAAGEYRLTVTDPGMEASTSAVEMASGVTVEMPAIALAMESANAEIQVAASRTEVAAAQVEMEQRQRVLGVIPNFYATYVWDAEPLTPRQKFGMAWKSTMDPVTFMMIGFMAGMEQSQDGFNGYHQGAAGFGRRYGAVFTDGLTSTLIGQAILPTVLRQDPRYFVKGTGSVVSRALYAVSATVICRGDNRRWQPNYSNVLGNVASASISNLYYPASDRHGAGLTVQNSLVGTAMGSIGNLFQEFVVRRLTPRVPDYQR